MKLGILVLSVLVAFSCPKYARAAEGDIHGEHQESLGGAAAPGPFSEGAIEVGNKICPVSGENVTKMGGGVQYEYKGKIYNFCCAMCLKDFQKDPEKYSKIAEESVQEDSPGVPEHEEQGSHGQHDH